ncbi:MAG: NADAR family protein [Candidatus Babeliaceae bacterium]|nr:NADAR family protein [Candidatus Babeliaceae bacterium]
MNSMTNMEFLLTAIQAGKNFEYLLFWGHQQRQDGRISKSCLSNWYPAAFTREGIEYLTTEHYMMAQKAKLFGDTAIYYEILKATTPKEAKNLGRKVQGFDETTWNANRIEIVVAGNLAKFSQHAPLSEFLLSTGEKVLVEASPYDRIWGIGMSADAPNVTDPQAWNGLNLLGFALMEVRRQLRTGG